MILSYTNFWTNSIFEVFFRSYSVNIISTIIKRRLYYLYITTSSLNLNVFIKNFSLDTKAIIKRDINIFVILEKSVIIRSVVHAFTTIILLCRPHENPPVHDKCAIMTFWSPFRFEKINNHLIFTVVLMKNNKLNLLHVIYTTIILLSFKKPLM
jgi:hypothetical protein